MESGWDPRWRDRGYHSRGRDIGPREHPELAPHRSGPLPMFRSPQNPSVPLHFSGQSPPKSRHPDRHPDRHRDRHPDHHHDRHHNHQADHHRDQWDPLQRLPRDRPHHRGVVPHRGGFKFPHDDLHHDRYPKIFKSHEGGGQSDLNNNNNNTQRYARKRDDHLPKRSKDDLDLLDRPFPDISTRSQDDADIASLSYSDSYRTRPLPDVPQNVTTDAENLDNDSVFLPSSSADAAASNKDHPKDTNDHRRLRTELQNALKAASKEQDFDSRGKSKEQSIPTRQVTPIARAGRSPKEGQLRPGKRPLMTDARSNSSDINDLSTIGNLTQDYILKVLRDRYHNDFIHTYIGNVLIVINPYHEIDIYNNKCHRQYDGVLDRDGQPPHCYWMADHSYRQMLDSRANQVILVSGESGSGKTETTKYMIKHMTHICRHSTGNLHEKIVQVNPLLEAFGNAMTVMNKNSSRFGKLVELLFTRSGHLVGAEIDTYLLEKSRVVHIQPQEQNYHVFYYLFAGLPREKLIYYYMEEPSEHRILQNGSDVFEDDSQKMYCKQMFEKMESIMKTVGFTQDDINTIYTCLSAVLYITNIQFEPDENTDGAVIVDEYPVKIVCELLSVDEKRLTRDLMCDSQMVNGEEVITLKKLSKANDGRDALAKTLYSRLFDWMVRQINTNIQPNDPALCAELKIGILDLSGFENFETNSFEQLCINVANEQLQNVFNQHIFTEEQRLYEQEGIQWNHIEFTNNDELLDIFFKKNLGMLDLLDEECNFPQASNKSLVAKWKQHLAGKHSLISTVDGQDLLFVVYHYADKVTYNASDFLEKNRDCFSKNLRECMKGSENEFIKDIFSAEISMKGSIAKNCKIRRSTQKGRVRSVNRRHPLLERSVSRDILENTARHQLGPPQKNKRRNSFRKQTKVTQHFRVSLNELMDKINASDPLFVRCIKPNSKQTAKRFDDSLVQRQLQYNGVLEIAKIRQLGYPVRLPFKLFIEKYSNALYPPNHRPDISPRECDKIIQCVNPRSNEYQIGKTKVFLKDHVAMDLKREAETKACMTIQRCVRGYLARIQYDRKKREAEEKRRLEKKRQEEKKKRRNSLNDLAPIPEDDKVSVSGSGHSQKADEESIYQELTTGASKDGTPSGGATPSSKDSGFGTSFKDADGMATSDPSAESSGSESGEDELDFEQQSWDLPQAIPRERISPSETFADVLKALKFFVYVILFIITLVTAVTSIGCLLMLEAAMVKDESHRASATNQLLWIVCFPHILTFIICFFKAMFGNMPWPTKEIFLLMWIMETAQSFGVCLLVFRVLPHFGSIYSLGLMNSVAVIPAILKVVFSKREAKLSKAASCASVMLIDIIAMGLQILAVAFPLFIRIRGFGTYRWASTKEEKPMAFYVHNFWQIPLSLFLISFKWWENYIDKNRGIFKLFKVKKKIHVVRTKSMLILSIWNVICTVGFIYLLDFLEGISPEFPDKLIPKLPINSTYIDDIFKYNPIVHHALTVSPAIVQIICGAMCYYCAVLACKLSMQRISFCLPIYLATPVIAIVIYLQCVDYLPQIPVAGGLRFEFLCDISLDNGGWYVIGAALWWLSLLWITSHVWFPATERLAMTEKLFVTRLYSGPLLLQSLLLNRRRNDSELSKRSDNKLYMNECRSQFLRGSKPSHVVTEEEKENTVSPDHPTPIIYACATMWHENRNEMIQLLKSIFRMDKDQNARRMAQTYFKIKDPDYYEFEAHVLFDDAMDLDEDDHWLCNSFVHLLVDVLGEAASSVHEVEKEMQPPTRIPTPYGGRLTWKLPGGNNLIIHLKDKNKIRHRKRWSQVMYMYYLLGYRLFGEEADMAESILAAAATDESTSTLNKDLTKECPYGKKISWVKTAMNSTSTHHGHFGKSQIFKSMEESLQTQAENTFILALDGDVDFKPDAVRLLVDRMRKNQKTGAACGRIHPIGSGPMVWYQIFEYAIGHWFQKATEHVLGCVLCSPGCFSLFRGSALLDDNVMKKYTTLPTEAVHYLQYDQGEDRWLCTLLLQQGYRVDYTAASDALTYAPEGFNEFFNQRRRWMPSTIANILDLLGDASTTVRVNDNISYLYMVYQFGLIMATLLGPATIALAISTAFESVLGTNLWQSYLLTLAPIVLYLIVCFTCKTNIQLTVGALLSTLYSAIMIVVLVGILRTIVTDSILNPSLFFLAVMVLSFIFAGIIHPYEIFCLAHGIIYFMCIPAGYLVLVIYSMSNMHVVSWGTREVPKKKSKANIEAEKKAAEQKKNEKKKGGGILSFFRTDALLQDLKDTLVQLFSSSKEPETQIEMLKTLKAMRKDIKKLNKSLSGNQVVSSSDSDSGDDKKKKLETDSEKDKEKKSSVVVSSVDKVEVDDPDNPMWIKDVRLGDGPVETLEADELIFWNRVIKKYLKPLKKDQKKEAKNQQDLIALRNEASFGFWFINGIWMLFNYMIMKDNELNTITVFGLETQPVGFVFMIFFVFVLVLQVIGMVIHRWGTFLQLISITDLHTPWRKKKMEKNVKTNNITEALKMANELQSINRGKFDLDTVDNRHHRHHRTSHDDGVAENAQYRHRRSSAKRLKEIEPRQLFGAVKDHLARHENESDRHRQRHRSPHHSGDIEAGPLEHNEGGLRHRRHHQPHSSLSRAFHKRYEKYSDGGFSRQPHPEGQRDRDHHPQYDRNRGRDERERDRGRDRAIRTGRDRDGGRERRDRDFDHRRAQRHRRDRFVQGNELEQKFTRRLGRMVDHHNM